MHINKNFWQYEKVGVKMLKLKQNYMRHIISKNKDKEAYQFKKSILIYLFAIGKLKEPVEDT